MSAAVILPAMAWLLARAISWPATVARFIHIRAWTYVLRDTPARGVGHAQVALGVSVALPGRRAILAHGLAVVLIDTQAMEVGNA